MACTLLPLYSNISAGVGNLWLTSQILMTASGLFNIFLTRLLQMKLFL